MRKLCYQNVDPDKFDLEIPERAKSKFWNEGRWKNFIEPLLPKDCSQKTFLEIGCNAGMYLKLAVDKGFARVVGTEKDPKSVEQAEYYRKKNGRNYKIIRQRTGVWNCKYDLLPMADVVLMSCVHYHMRPVELIEMLDHLRTHAYQVILVSIEDVKQRKVNRVPGSEETAMKYFIEWERVKTVKIKADDDPTPRPMFSMLLKSKLRHYRIYDLLNPAYYNKKLRIFEYCDAFSKFAERIIRKNYEYKDTEFYRLYVEGRRKKLGMARKKRIKKLITMIEDVYENGMKKPLLVNRLGHLLDGSHRVILLQHLGFKEVLCREVY
jgi:SAM-dependent methyltransferase